MNRAAHLTLRSAGIRNIYTAKGQKPPVRKRELHLVLHAFAGALQRGCISHRRTTYVKVRGGMPATAFLDDASWRRQAHQLADCLLHEARGS